MTKKAYGSLLMNELTIMEDYGFYLPYRAVREFKKMNVESQHATEIILRESAAHEYRSKKGRLWKTLFWEGDLKPNTYLEMIKISDPSD